MRSHKAACVDRLNTAPGPCPCGAVEWGEMIRRAIDQGAQVPTSTAAEFFEALVDSHTVQHEVRSPGGVPSGMNTGVAVSPELLEAQAGALGEAVALVASREVAMAVAGAKVRIGERLVAQLTAIRWDQGRHQVRVLTAFCRVPA